MWLIRHLKRQHFMCIVSSSIASLLLRFQREQPQAVWYHLPLSWCTMISEVKRRGVLENKISISPYNIILLTDDCPPRWCIQQTPACISLGWFVQFQFSLFKNVSNIYAHSSYDERIQRKQSAQYRKRRAITVKVTLTSARCDTVFYIRRWRRWSSDRCRGRLCSVLGAIDVDGLTWRQVDTSNLQFNCVDSFARLSIISTFFSRHKLHNPDRRWQMFDGRSFFHVMGCSTFFSLSCHIYFDNSVSFL